jgi:hypothetical protein
MRMPSAHILACCCLLPDALSGSSIYRSIVVDEYERHAAMQYVWVSWRVELGDESEWEDVRT